MIAVCEADLTGVWALDTVEPSGQRMEAREKEMKVSLFQYIHDYNTIRAIGVALWKSHVSDSAAPGTVTKDIWATATASVISVIR